MNSDTLNSTEKEAEHVQLVKEQEELPKVVHYDNPANEKRVVFSFLGW